MDSFVMYRSFHEALKELSREQYGNVMYAINEYALDGVISQDLTGIEKAVFLMAKPQLDSNRQRRENGNQGGRPSKKQEKPMVFENENQEKPMVIENAENEKPNVNVNANENVNAKGNENLNAGAEIALGSPFQANLSNQIFEIYEAEDLPHSKGGEISFIQKDFKNAISFIHSSPEYSGIHSDDIIQAVKNYAESLKNPNNYITQRMDFYTFARSKLFYKMLPGIYEGSDFTPFTQKGRENTKPKREYIGDECPHCHKSTFYYNNDMGNYECDSCGHSESYERYQEWKAQKI